MLRRFRVRRYRYHITKGRKYINKGIKKLITTFFEYENLVKKTFVYMYNFLLIKKFKNNNTIYLFRKLLLEKSRCI